jgi:ubiquinone/menaquinone biosynthesis C-methylase UbiE
MEKENWPVSYLGTFAPFINDEKSSKSFADLLDHHSEKARFQTRLSLLDVCCGTGIAGRAVSSHLKSQGHKVDTTFLDTSKQTLCSIALGADEYRRKSDVVNMRSLMNGRFDFVVCRYGFNNLPQEEWMLALNEVLRVLKPGGIFLLQDHFVPGPTFSALVNEAEQFLARLEGKPKVPFIYSTETFNSILDEHPMVLSRVKVAYGFWVSIWDRLKSKKELLPDFDIARDEILRFYKEVCLKKYHLLINEPDQYIHVFNITYAIVKRS